LKEKTEKKEVHSVGDFVTLVDAKQPYSEEIGRRLPVLTGVEESLKCNLTEESVYE